MKRSERARELGQYFTPREAAGFVLEAARGLVGCAGPIRLLDPACGDGVFLELALERGAAARSDVFGIEIDPDHARAGSRLGLGERLALADALADPLPPAHESARRAGFDLVVGNPPFGGGRGGGRLEMRFLERFAVLAGPGGAGGVILPSGIFANATSQALRDRLLESVAPTAVVELPAGTFRRTGAAARTCALFFTKRRALDSDLCAFVRCPDRVDPRAHFDSALRAVANPGAGGARRVPVRDLAGRRWDPAYWCHEADSVLAGARVPLEPLGRFVEHITYGPIVTGGRRKMDAPPAETGVSVIGLRELAATGVDLRRARKVCAGSLRDPPRCRLRRGDIVMARSGAGSLMKGRLAVFDGPDPATVGCFVDLVRLKGMDPGYAALCLRSRVCRVQVERIANGVGTPNISFGEIKALMIPRLDPGAEARFARLERSARDSHEEALGAGRQPLAAARHLAAAVGMLDEAVFGGNARTRPA